MWENPPPRAAMTSGAVIVGGGSADLESRARKRVFIEGHRPVCQDRPHDRRSPHAPHDP